MKSFRLHRFLLSFVQRRKSGQRLGGRISCPQTAWTERQYRPGQANDLYSRSNCLQSRNCMRQCYYSCPGRLVTACVIIVRRTVRVCKGKVRNAVNLKRSKWFAFLVLTLLCQLVLSVLPISAPAHSQGSTAFGGLAQALLAAAPQEPSARTSVRPLNDARTNAGSGRMLAFALNYAFADFSDQARYLQQGPGRLVLSLPLWLLHRALLL